MQSRFCSVKNGKLHYLEGGEGMSLILLPGIWSTSKAFEHLGVLLSKHFHILIPDIYKGKSEFSNTPNSLMDYSDVLYEFVTKMGLLKFSLLGWSIGGMIVSRYAQKYPQNLHKLIFLCTTTMHMDFVENPMIISRGYIKLIGKNIRTLKGLYMVWLWVYDASLYFLRHPVFFIKEVQIGMYDDTLKKSEKMPVPSKLLIAKNDEFISSRELSQANQDIENLEIEVINGRHEWFYHDVSLFISKVTEFIKKG
jgi:pimeloyl-ACP methyl ester carboxylesterase